MHIFSSVRAIDSSSSVPERQTSTIMRVQKSVLPSRKPLNLHFLALILHYCQH